MPQAAAPGWLCSLLNDGGRSGPDEDGITWECICTSVSSGNDALCQWVAVDWPEPEEDTWINRNLNSHRCLGITGGSTATGAQAVTWWCDGSADQQWC